MLLKNKGFQPFNINGKFVSKQVFELKSFIGVQSNELIYELTKEKVNTEFKNVVLTC